jgi:hypothetical protein
LVGFRPPSDNDDKCLVRQQPPMMSGLLNPLALMQGGAAMPPGANNASEIPPPPAMQNPDGNALLAMLQRQPTPSSSGDFPSQVATPAAVVAPQISTSSNVVSASDIQNLFQFFPQACKQHENFYHRIEQTYNLIRSSRCSSAHDGETAAFKKVQFIRSYQRIPCASHTHMRIKSNQIFP